MSDSHWKSSYLGVYLQCIVCRNAGGLAVKCEKKRGKYDFKCYVLRRIDDKIEET